MFSVLIVISFSRGQGIRNGNEVCALFFFQERITERIGIQWIPLILLLSGKGSFLVNHQSRWDDMAERQYITGVDTAILPWKGTRLRFRAGFSRLSLLWDYV